MEAILNTILTPLPSWLAFVLIVVGAVSLVLGLIRLGYGAAVRLVSWAITEETMSKVIQFFFDRARAALQKQ